MARSDDNVRRKASRDPSVRTIVGFSLSPDMARKVKEEARRRKIRLKRLFEEMWEVYQRQRRE